MNLLNKDNYSLQLVRSDPEVKMLSERVQKQKLGTSQQAAERIYIVCLNPHCLRSDERCLTTRTLHAHPPQCSQYYYPADEVIDKHWMELEKYPSDSLGMAAKKKCVESQNGNYLQNSILNLKKKLQTALLEVQERLSQLYPQKQFLRCYSNMYGLEKISESLKLRRSPVYISKLISNNFSSQNYHLLLRLNESYDEIRNLVESLSDKLMSSFDNLLQRHKKTQLIPSGRPAYKKYNYGIYKSKFVASLKIQINKSTVNFPKIQNIASFLPWIYTDRYFTEGTHEFKINSLRYPIVQNAGFTVLEEHDIDTYPYTYFKSLFSREGKGFKLVKGEEIDQFVAQSTVITLRLDLGPQPKAIIYDSEMMCQYECQLAEKKAYRMGVYACGWAMQIIQLN